MIKVIKTKYGKPLLEWEDLECYVKDLEKEIEKLNYIIDKQDRDITALSNGNRKLNNIINGMEKWLKEGVKTIGKNRRSDHVNGILSGYVNSFRKLQELKGDSSSE